jgi:hypothetical protein
MKPRRVIVTIEMTTGAPIAALKAEFKAGARFAEIIHQVQVNVVKQQETKKSR